MSDNRWQALFDAVPDALLVLSRDGTVRDVNLAGRAILDVAHAEDMVGMSVYDYVATAQHDAFRAFVERMSEGKTDTIDLSMVGRKGIARLLAIQVALLRDEPDERGGREGLLLIARDVTRLRNIETALRESRKMAAAGQLVGSFAHDFSNLLTGIMGGLWMVAGKLGADHPAWPMVAAAGQAGRRATDLVRRLMTLGRCVKGDACLVALPSLIEEMGRRMRVMFDPRIAVVIQADPETWPVYANPVELRQALLHVCENACDAMSQGGRLQIELGNMEKDGGAYARLAISDTGTGIASESLPQIFEPFFTTKSEGQSLGQGVGQALGEQALGLGLTVAQEIVTRCEGTIAVKSEPGKGTRFVIEIPRHVEAKAAPVPEPAALPSIAPQDTGRVVLIVDDEEILRVVARATLEQAGYAVLEAADAASALAVYQQERARIGIVLTDVRMPGRSGLELLADLRAFDSTVRVVLCSGSMSVGSQAEVDRLGAKAFLPKPYSSREIIEVVGQVLA